MPAIPSSTTQQLVPRVLLQIRIIQATDTPGRYRNPGMIQLKNMLITTAA
jgi:hypothetical protein